MLQKYRDCMIKRSGEIQRSAAYKIFFKQIKKCENYGKNN